jgi:hypothetical protein
MKLNARQVETAKPAEKDYKLPDGNGLILLVKPAGPNTGAIAIPSPVKKRCWRSVCTRLFRWRPLAKTR